MSIYDKMKMIDKNSVVYIFLGFCIYSSSLTQACLQRKEYGFIGPRCLEIHVWKLPHFLFVRFRRHLDTPICSNIISCVITIVNLFMILNSLCFLKPHYSVDSHYCFDQNRIEILKVYTLCKVYNRLKASRIFL